LYKISVFIFYGGTVLVISERLKTIIGCVKKRDFLVDVGTDHAYVPISLIKSGVIKKAIACDISPGSVEKAKKNIQLHNYSDLIETRIGDGLSVINEGESPNQIVIAGMGGLMITHILSDSKDVVNSAERLILQPQRDIDKVRKTIHLLGFKIVDEKMLFQDGKYYNVIVCEKGLDSYYTEKDYFFGKILIAEKNEVLKKQVDFELNKLNNILIDMEKRMLESKQNDVFLKRFDELGVKRCLYESIWL